LNVLLNSGVGDVAVVVTRYFGGVKLGRGGLVRAYGGSAQRVLQGLSLTERVFFVHIEVTVDYAAVETVRRLTSACEGTVAEESFGQVAVSRVDIPEERVGEFESGLRDATGGRARFERIDKK
jgi:putative IMPACT (imprinted ancient) family translation regulator